MRKRVCGLETEYGLAIEQADRSLLMVEPGRIYNALEDAMRYQCQTLQANSLGNTDVADSEGIRIEIKEGWFLENGARFYFDAGHVEWATPEVLGPKEAGVYDVAGERLLSRLAETLNSGKPGRYLLVKNNVDYATGATYGCHENYQVPRRIGGYSDRKSFNETVKQLVPHLVSRQIYCGAGKVGVLEENGSMSMGYQMSQRADYIQKIVSKDTRSERGIVNERDETLASENDFRRLHLIVGDSNMIPFASFMKLGTTSLILDMIEDRFLRKTPSLKDPVAAIKIISTDLSCKTGVSLVRGNRLSALGIQEWYLEQAKRWCESQDLDQERAEVLAEWERLLVDLDEAPERAVDRVDWLAKKIYFLDPILEAHSWDWEHLSGHHAPSRKSKVSANTDKNSELATLYYELCERDLRYHDINPETGLSFLLHLHENLLPGIGEVQFKRALTTPPKTTRAVIRGQIIRWAHKYNLCHRIHLDWDKVIFSDPGKVFHLQDARATENRGLEAEFRRRLFGVVDPDEPSDIHQKPSEGWEIKILDEIPVEPPDEKKGGIFKRLLSKAASLGKTEK